MSDIYQVGHLERVPLGTPYPGIVAHVGRLLGKFPNPELIIDYTGVGRPVFDLFTYAGISPVGVLITGGAVEARYGATCGVPKLTLVSRLQALLHQGQLKIQKELSEAETLVRELQDFRVEFTATGHLTFNARAGKHDDLVLALAIAIWRAYGGVVRRVELADPAAAAEAGRSPEPTYECGQRCGRRSFAAAELLATGIPVVLAGDFNVMPTELDVHKPERWVDDALFRPEVREAFRCHSPRLAVDIHWPITGPILVRRLTADFVAIEGGGSHGGLWSRNSGNFIGSGFAARQRR